MNLKLSSFIGMSVLLFGFTIPAAQASKPPCPFYKLVGQWSFSEQGSFGSNSGPISHAAFSQVGWFKLGWDGKGKGETHLSINGTSMPDNPLNIKEVVMDPDTCVGSALFTSKGSADRTITFVFNKRVKEFDYISTTGDLTVLGTGKKQAWR